MNAVSEPMTAPDEAPAERRPEFISILFGERPAPPGLDDQPAPGCFGDLNLDQIIAAVVGPKEPYRLTGYYHTPLDTVTDVVYRQEVFRDLERPEIRESITDFAAAMERVRARLTRAQKAYHVLQRQRWQLDAANTYCQALTAMDAALELAGPYSTGLRAWHGYLIGYLASPAFTALRNQTADVHTALDEISYDVWVRGARVTVGGYDDEADYSAAVTATFQRFRQHVDLPPERRRTTRISVDIDHVEAQILEQVAKIFPAQFALLAAFNERYAQFTDSVIIEFDREIEFYLGYLDYITPMRNAGLRFDYPALSASDKTESAFDTFDLALAARLVPERREVVTNDYRLEGAERILVISGPNNGGKTTLARTIGQLHYLARLGCPLPGHELRLLLVDAIYTHFEVAEDIASLAGKLQDELNRLHADLQLATSRSLVIMNEMFNSTTVQDALFLSKEMLYRVSELDALGVCVTFLDELSTLNDTTISMVSMIDPDDPARRTYRVIRRTADGRAYARALAEKYGLTYQRLSERVNR